MGRKKKEALTQFNRNNILETAKKLFHENGLNQTTMDDIAKYADYSKSTIYVYFKSKEEIYLYLIYRNLVNLETLLEKCIDLNNIEQSFFNICNTLVMFHQENPLFLETALMDYTRIEEDVKKYPILDEIIEINQDIERIISELIETGINNSILQSELTPLFVVHILWGSICGIIYMSDKRGHYLSKSLNINIEDYLSDSFKMLFKSIKMNQ